MTRCDVCNGRVDVISCANVSRTGSHVYELVSCRDPYCVRSKSIPVVAPYYPYSELFPRRSLDNHRDEDDPGFENAVRCLEDG